MKRLRRKSPRLRSYDYRKTGIYYVTICTHNRLCVFGDVVDDAVILSHLGKVTHHEWLRTVELRPYVENDVFVVMPNHVHLLFALFMHEADEDCEGAGSQIQRAGASAAASRSVPAIIGGYKSAVTRLARRAGLWGTGPLWQGRYYDRIARSDAQHGAFHNYILDNPRRWREDRFYRSRVSDEDGH